MSWKRVELIAGAIAVAIVLAAALFPARRAALQYRMTGSQWWFNVAVSRAVPKGASLGQLQAVVGPGSRTGVPAWVEKMAAREPGRFPDGVRAGDSCVAYSFPGSSRWYFQVRDGRLVNYDPAVLSGQPQERVFAKR